MQTAFAKLACSAAVPRWDDEIDHQYFSDQNYSSSKIFTGSEPRWTEIKYWDLHWKNPNIICRTFSGQATVCLLDLTASPGCYRRMIKCCDGRERKNDFYNISHCSQQLLCSLLNSRPTRILSVWTSFGTRERDVSRTGTSHTIFGEHWTIMRYSAALPGTAGTVREAIKV